jgi:hypothetical protein
MNGNTNSTPSHTATVLAVIAGSLSACAQLIPVPNGSFESPATTYITVALDNWQKPAAPGWFDPNAYGFQWVQGAGGFLNTPVGKSDHIDNVDGAQAAYILPIPGEGLYQDLTGAVYQTGISYELNVGLLGKGMPDGNTLTLSLYYRDGGGNAVSVGSTTVTYTAASLPSTTHLTDFTVDVASVPTGAAWAGKAIGISITAGAGTGVGYWDLDNVRLVSTPEPGVMALAAVGSAVLLAAGRRRRR